MSLENDIALLKRQEERLRFSVVDEAAAFDLGSRMRQRAESAKLPLVIDIRLGIRQLFYTVLPGSTAENQDWVRRKVNTVYRFDACSYRVTLEYRLSGKAFDQTRGMPPLDYANAGGGFPIRLSGQVVGAVTVSGLPQRQDHAFVAQSLAEYFGVAYTDIALSADED